MGINLLSNTRIIACNKNLKTWKFAASNLCTYCTDEIDTTEHFFSAHVKEQKCSGEEYSNGGKIT